MYDTNLRERIATETLQLRLYNKLNTLTKQEHKRTFKMTQAEHLVQVNFTKRNCSKILITWINQNEQYTVATTNYTSPVQVWIFGQYTNIHIWIHSKQRFEKQIVIVSIQLDRKYLPFCTYYLKDCWHYFKFIFVVQEINYNHIGGVWNWDQISLKWIVYIKRKHL